MNLPSFSNTRLLPLLARTAVGKFEQCVDAWHQNPLVQFAVQLGDIIDGNETEELTEKDFEDVDRVIRKCQLPLYHVIGNHCLRYPGGKAPLMKRLGMKEDENFYRLLPTSKSVIKTGHVFLVLDGTDVALNKWSPEDAKSKLAEEWLEKHPIEKFSNAVNWNGAISEEQLVWFKQQLEDARTNGNKVFVFCHYPILADHLVMAISLLWNHDTLVELCDAYSDVVVGWFSGHYHHGGAQIPTPTQTSSSTTSSRRKWAHITLEAILMAEEQSYAVVDVFERGIVLNGTGSCTSHRWAYSPSEPKNGTVHGQ